MEVIGSIPVLDSDFSDVILPIAWLLVSHRNTVIISVYPKFLN